ncbi:Putative uncharacterized protein FLJ37770, partial [Habropoda laboriosa]
ERVSIKFCFNLKKTASKTVEMLQIAFGDTCMSYNRFKNGRTFVENDPREGRLSTSTTEEKKKEIEALLKVNRRFTIRVRTSRHINRFVSCNC